MLTTVYQEEFNFYNDNHSNSLQLQEKVSFYRRHSSLMMNQTDLLRMNNRTCHDYALCKKGFLILKKTAWLSHNQMALAFEEAQRHSRQTDNSLEKMTYANLFVEKIVSTTEMDFGDDGFIFCCLRWISCCTDRWRTCR